MIVSCGRTRVMRIRVMEAVHFDDPHAERLEPGEKPVQGRLIPEGAMQDRFDRLHRRGEPLEVKQGFGRENPDYADLVVGRRQRTPSRSRWTKQTPRSCVPACGTPCTAGEQRVNCHPGEITHRVMTDHPHPSDTKCNETTT